LIRIKISRRPLARIISNGITNSKSAGGYRYVREGSVGCGSNCTGADPDSRGRIATGFNCTAYYFRIICIIQAKRVGSVNSVAFYVVINIDITSSEPDRVFGYKTTNRRVVPAGTVVLEASDGIEFSTCVLVT
jgi:hypothetical protein